MVLFVVQVKKGKVRPYFARSHESLIKCVVSQLAYCYLSFSPFRALRFCFEACSLMLGCMAFAGFLVLILFPRPSSCSLCVRQFPAMALVLVVSLSLSSPTFPLRFIFLSSIVSGRCVSVGTKNESTLSYFLHALVAYGEVKVFSSYCVKAIRLPRVAV